MRRNPLFEHQHRANSKNPDIPLRVGINLALFGSIGFAGLCAQTPHAAVGGWLIGERGHDFAIYPKVTALTNAQGQAKYQTNSFTLLENGLHYLENQE